MLRLPCKLPIFGSVLLVENGLAVRRPGHILGRMYSGLSDEEAVSRCLAGDHEAFAFIVRRYQARFLRLGAGALRDRDAAEDVVQETFVRAFMRLERYHPQGSFAAWLFTIFSHCLKDQLRRAKRYGGFLERLAAHLQGEETAQEEETAPRDTSWIRPALAGLSGMQRMCILLRDIEGLSTADVAGQLGIEEATVRVHLLRGRRRLREIYERKTKDSHLPRAQ